MKEMQIKIEKMDETIKEMDEKMKKMVKKGQTASKQNEKAIGNIKEKMKEQASKFENEKKKLVLEMDFKNKELEKIVQGSKSSSDKVSSSEMLDVQADLIAAQKRIARFEEVRSVYEKSIEEYSKVLNENIRLTAQCELLEPAARCVTLGFPDGTTIQEAYSSLEKGWLFLKAENLKKNENANFALQELKML
jgi:hypothetical protein